MVGQIYHVGLTVTDMDRSLAFYRDVLGLAFQGELVMQGPETDLLFQRSDCRARVAYLNGSDDLHTPPVELIQFLDTPASPVTPSLFQSSISELCFLVEDIETVYRWLLDRGVDCLSAPQMFDFTAQGFGKSKALYFKDPDGIILELMQPLEEV